jgi:hypothetical protein
MRLAGQKHAPCHPEGVEILATIEAGRRGAIRLGAGEPTFGEPPFARRSPSWCWSSEGPLRPADPPRGRDIPTAAFDGHIPSDRSSGALSHPGPDNFRQSLEPFYSQMGRPSGAWELMVRMLIVNHCMSSRSEHCLQRGSPSIWPIAKRSAGVIRAGGTLVTISGPTEARPGDGRTVDFVVPDPALSEIVRRARDGRARTNIGNVAALDDAIAAFNPTQRIKGKTIIHVRPWGPGEGERFCLYTSGTTGAPKGVVRDIAGYLVALEWSMSDNCDAPVFC